MTTTTIGNFQITHIAGVVKMLTEGDEMIVGAAACRLALAAATDIDRLRAIKGDTMNEIQSAINGKLVDLINERDKLKSELAASKEEIEQLRAALDTATAGRASSAQGYRDVIREVSDDRERIKAELAASKEEIERLRAALDAAKTGRASAAEGYREVIRELSEDRERIRAELAAAVAASPVVIGIRDGDYCLWMPMTCLPFYDADYRLKMDDGSVIKNEHGWKGFKGIDHRKITAWGITEAQVVSLLEGLRRSHEDMDAHLAASQTHVGDGVGK